MKFSVIFLIVSLIIAVGAKWNIPSCIIVICASINELIEVTPKLWRSLHGKQD